MNAPTHPITADGALAIFTPAFADLVNLRIKQVTKDGHTAESDDRRGVRSLIDRANAELIDANMRAGRGKWPMQPDQLELIRRHLLRSAAIAIAAIDVIDRTPAMIGGGV